MAKVIVGMTTSLDGFVNDRNGSVERIYPDLEALRKTEFLREAIAYTGAAVRYRSRCCSRCSSHLAYGATATSAADARILVT